ncbi:DUF1385 domain-containing protein [Candidatus Woesearchaeota archaeon]|jgi:uncharacterized protein YqhQ|nr:DUF1385 domain-containing protein [Candidatus Woesearchaeota archaeon]MBT3438917.1 DUF1385 domain-containing protein [Candidatus Woesearchaeota archaeon]MBT4058197.1 DUF1385 domain-containing protein [Candidatus Woesearchaeota archaeon]MBT4206838.1 DUF1385 domain-containing protein [Candidatus Woesearchaeota archaeon]MBT4731012.1 DUF1385 domain-containing protein [Candidatus Woesearchaeota archaeon]
MKEYIGGQAVMEGVMMASRKKIAIAVRKEDGKIKTKIEKRSNISEKFKDMIFLRGIISLFEMLIIGTKALTWSSNESLGEEEEIGSWGIFFMLMFSFSISIGLFIVLPLWLSKFASEDRIIFNIVDGIWRVIFFVGYLWFISRFEDVKRIFQYHGAEHKVVSCYESGKALTVKNAKKFSTIHPRCGTSFIFIVLVISIIMFSLVWSESWLIKLLHRLVLIPVIAMISYELLRLNARNPSKILGILVTPGLWLQRITTNEPEDKQLEVAIKALKSAM